MYVYKSMWYVNVSIIFNTLKYFFAIDAATLFANNEFLLSTCNKKKYIIYFCIYNLINIFLFLYFNYYNFFLYNLFNVN